MALTKYVAFGTVIALIAILAWAYFMVGEAKAPTTNTGVNPAASDYTYVNASADTVTVDTPKANDVVGKTFSVLGKARGPFFFEASFPVQLLKPDGTVLAQGHAQVNPPMTDWMTNDFVPFKADLTVNDINYIGPATLILHNDNPSGLPENAASMSYPITVEY